MINDNNLLVLCNCNLKYFLDEQLVLYFLTESDREGQCFLLGELNTFTETDVLACRYSLSWVPCLREVHSHD